MSGDRTWTRLACRWLPGNRPLYLALNETQPLQEFTFSPGYTAALAAEGHGWRLTYWEWPDPRQQSV